MVASCEEDWGREWFTTPAGVPQPLGVKFHRYG